MEHSFDIIVVGGGHAGCEAAHAAARLGCRTALITMELAQVAKMSCNPSIGGPAKGHLTREIDALGGLQAMITDRTYLSIRMLNTGKGASVRALRAQCDRNGYSREMLGALRSTPGLELIEGEAADVLTAGTERRHASGVRLTNGRELAATRVVICPGTFTRAVCFMGERRHNAGRWGECSADALGEGLDAVGMPLQRLKTGTSPRIHRDSIDYTRLDPQLSEWRPDAFCNYAPSMLPAWFLPNWLAKTTIETRDLLLENKLKSALYSGAISGAGPRYCPSIEDKVVRFPDARTHPVFIEPDGLDVEIMYLQGLSTSMPLDVQRAFLGTVPGLENSRIKQPGYAVEYDSINPVDLKPTLEYRQLAGLYCAGQFNGTSGYEEAGAQGLAAGANAALSLNGREPLPLTRENSYCGVMIDDLTTRGTEEPYRMLTARAEHRLLLRHDNAMMRLGPIARDWGLLSDEQRASLERLRTRVFAVQAELKKTKITADRQRALGIATQLGESIYGEDAVRRGAPVSAVLAENGERAGESGDNGSRFFEDAAMEHVEVELRYAGYLARARGEIEKVKEHHDRAIPADFDFELVAGLLKATREHLLRALPRTLGQASRVPGVTPADLANLLVALKRHAGEGWRGGGADRSPGE